MRAADSAGRCRSSCRAASADCCCLRHVQSTRVQKKTGLHLRRSAESVCFAARWSIMCRRGMLDSILARRNAGVDHRGGTHRNDGRGFSGGGNRRLRARRDEAGAYHFPARSHDDPAVTSHTIRADVDATGDAASSCGRLVPENCGMRAVVASDPDKIQGSRTGSARRFPCSLPLACARFPFVLSLWTPAQKTLRICARGTLSNRHATGRWATMDFAFGDAEMAFRWLVRQPPAPDFIGVP